MNNKINFDENNIALSFCLLSDVHITSNKPEDQCYKNYENAVRLAYEHSKDGKLELALIAGDMVENIAWDKEYGKHLHELYAFKELTDKFLKKDTALIFCTGNHDKSPIANYEKDFTDTFAGSDEDIKRYYKYDVDMESVFAYTGNRHAIVNGYHFISVAMHGDYISYMKPLLDKISAEEPDKPIFVAYHYHAAETVYATHYSSGRGLEPLKELLNAYPQVIFLSGHSHNALENPRAIWQGNFTAIDTASLRYLDDNSLINFNIKIPVNATHGEVFAFASESLLIEVDKDHNVRFTCFNAYRGDIVATYTVGAPKSDGSHLLTYTQEREKLSAPPRFTDADFKLTRLENGDIGVHFNQAEHEDIVWYYTIRFFDGENEVQKFYFTSRYYDKDGMPELIDSTIIKDENMPEYDNHKGFGAHKLTEGVTYKAVLNAYDVWDHPGDDIVLEFEY